MDLTNREHLYKIVCARDKRYDGRFYIGVHTTGIYCRPICPARPKIENIDFFRSPAEAENRGFRPCLRCRPDLAPNSNQWNGTAAIVGRALNLITRGELNESSIQELSEKLGVSDRHLRRLFDEHIGASPVEVAASHRLHLAKQLLTQSSLAITDVAFAAGFQSLRRFNEAFKKKFEVPPSYYRKKELRADKGSNNFVRIHIPVIMPYDWDQVIEFFRSHSVEGVDSVQEKVYRRAIRIGKSTGALEVSFDHKNELLLVNILLADLALLRTAIEQVRDLFDTRLNPHSHLTQERNSDSVAAIYNECLGLRIPGSWDPFETAITIILGQLVSVQQARLLTKRLVQNFGTPIKSPVFPECKFTFPTAAMLAKADIQKIGITKARALAIQQLAQLVHEGKLDISRTSDLEETKSQLLAIKGIGPWTVQMIAMRCLGDTNAFPKSDLIIRRALEHHDNLKGDWSPWNAYITLALWKKYARILNKKATLCT